jgi:hypothetical protein
MDNSIVTQYLNLNKKTFTNVNEINAFEPNPNQQDYVHQYIFRYFIRKRNEQNGLIYEVNKKTFDSIKDDSLYFGVSISWKIYGDKNETQIANKKSIQLGKQTISNLDNYLNDYLKFWKG